ncbi:cobalamin biosynthesis protein, partial [Yoonia sp.]|uniref:cobalamin biosynthesis protein n=1 Tax=Yoonia sp. TaxID=2212373 RepID=UPI003974ABE0
MFAMLLDALLGEPKWLWSRFPHPAVLMGRLIGWCDRTFNKGERRRLTGVLTLVALCIAAGVSGWIIQLAPGYLLDVIV